LTSAMESEKDYVHIDDVCDALVDIAEGGHQRIYNVAHGENISHARWVAHLRSLTGCRVEVQPGAPLLRMAPIEVTRVRAEFGRTPRAVLGGA
jgi:nucleoside-diphosphate-sugar epimerase